MKKIFLYLYPIKEYNNPFEISATDLQQLGQENPYEILKECIQKRYRENNYQIVYAIYPDKNIYGIKPQSTDKIIFTDVTFEQASGYNKDGSKKCPEEIKYPNEHYLIEQLGDFDEIVVGGFHFSDCVKRIAEYCYQYGVNTLVDLDLTDLFFNVYSRKDYFKIDKYNSQDYKEFMISNLEQWFGDRKMAERFFERKYDSVVYGFVNNEKTQALGKR